VKNPNGLVGLLGIFFLAGAIASCTSTSASTGRLAAKGFASASPGLLLQSEYAVGLQSIASDQVPVYRHPIEQEKLTLTGLGPIVIGMSVEQAEQVSGVNLVAIETSTPQACQYYLVAPDGLGKSDVGFMVIDKRIIRIDVWPGSAVQTASQVGIGSLAADVKTQYLGRLEETPHKYAEGTYLTLVPDGDVANLYRMVFETDAEGRITQFRSGQFPAVTWVEGCS
jgi:hypothetical protein